MIPFLVFITCMFAVFGVYLLATRDSEAKRKRLQQRLSDVLLYTKHSDDGDVQLARRHVLPSVREPAHADGGRRRLQDAPAPRTVSLDPGRERPGAGDDPRGRERVAPPTVGWEQRDEGGQHEGGHGECEGQQPDPAVGRRRHVAGHHLAAEERLHQQVWMLSGSMEVTCGNEHQLLEEGDCFAMSLDRITAFRNPGAKAARYAVVIQTRSEARR